ncbi:MAG TPA: cyclophilin-like fold protein [bacterium]|nr:cyclophilin-like fold protein [bacterium]HQL61578.1 cyclophilin-like fold protein [bacterium]
MKIRIIVGEIRLEAELLANETAQAIYQALPIESGFSTWGDEIYFSIPVKRELEKGTTDVEMGDLGYWPPGKAFCIFYGPTPASDTDKPVPASKVTVIGRVIGDATVLRDAAASKIRLEPVSAESE